MKSILVTGANGQLGQAVSERLSDCFRLILTDISVLDKDQSNIRIMDITNDESVSRMIQNVQPDVLLHLASVTNVDQCDADPEFAQKVNLDGTKILLKHFSGKFVFISTDYVFDGTSGPYAESDDLSPINEYGRTKLLAEKAVMESDKANCIIRTNVVFDYTKNTQASFVKWVVDSLRAGKPIRVVNDQWNNPTWTIELAEAIVSLIEGNFSGLWHYGGADYINRLDFAKKIANIFNLDASLISPITTKELNQKAPRPLKGGLVTKQIESAGIRPYSLEKSLKEIYKRINI